MNDLILLFVLVDSGICRYNSCYIPRSDLVRMAIEMRFYNYVGPSFSFDCTSIRSWNGRCVDPNQMDKLTILFLGNPSLLDIHFD